MHLFAPQLIMMVSNKKLHSLLFKL